MSRAFSADPRLGLTVGTVMDAQQIATLCGVSRSTAYRWLQRPESMPVTAQRLIALFVSGRVLPLSWRGWRFTGDELISPVGDAMKPAQVEQWRLYCDWWRAASRENDCLKEYVEYLEKVAPRAEVIQFPQQRTRASQTVDKELNPLFEKD